MNAHIQQPPVLDDLLRVFHGWQGDVLFILALLLIATVLASILSVGRFMFTRAPRGTPTPLNEAVLEQALRAIHRPPPVRQWQQPAAKHCKAATMNDHRSIVVSLAERRLP